MNKAIIISIICLMFVSLCFAQKKKPDVEITIDGDSKLPDKYAPFDQEFILNIPVDSSYKESEIKKRFAIFEVKRGSSHNNYNASLESFPAKKISFTKSKEKYSVLKVISPPMRANHDYAVAIQFEPESTFKSLLEYNEMLDNSTFSEADRTTFFDDLIKSMNEFNKGAIQELRNGVDNPKAGFKVTPIDRVSYDDFYSSKIFPEVKLFKASFFDSANVLSDIENFKEVVEKCSFCALMSKCNCENSFIVEELKISLSQSLLVTCGFDQLKIGTAKTPSDFTPIVSSQTSLDSLTSGTASKDKFYRSPKILLANLKSNISYFISVRDLLQESTFTSVMPDSCRIALINLVKTIIDKLEKQQRDAMKHLGNIEKILRASLWRGINNDGSNPFFTYIQVFTVNSSTATITAEAGNHIIPEVGLVNMISNKTFDGPTYFLRPYVGINVSIKPINKDIRLKDIRTWRYKKKKNEWSFIKGATLGHRLSLSVGVTRQSISTNHPEVSDLLKDMCLMTGLNVRLTRAFRIGLGTTWYRADNPNPLLSDKVYAMPYVSLALDVDVVNLANSITDYFIK